MIIKESQLQREWPLELSPEQREQFLKEKAERVCAWYEFLRKHDQYHPDLKRS